MLSLRQQLLEDNHSLLEHLTSLRKKMREEKAAEMETLSRNLALRYQANEKNMVIDGKTSATKEFLEIFENQVSFFTESIKTIDNVIFGIKTRLDIEKTLGL
jgi:flagellar motor component MotA